MGERDSGKLYTRTLGVVTQLGIHPITSVPSVLRHWARTGSRSQAAPGLQDPGDTSRAQTLGSGIQAQARPGKQGECSSKDKSSGSRVSPPQGAGRRTCGPRGWPGVGQRWACGKKGAHVGQDPARCDLPLRDTPTHHPGGRKTSEAAEMGHGAWGLSLRLSLHREPGHPASFGGEQRAGQRRFEARCRRRYGVGRGWSRGAPRPARRSPRPWSHCPGAPHSLSSPRKLSRGRRWGCGRPAFRTLGLVCGGRGRGGGGGPGAVRLPHFSRKPGNPLGPCWRGRCQGVLCAVDCERPGPKASEPATGAPRARSRLGGPGRGAPAAASGALRPGGGARESRRAAPDLGQRRRPQRGPPPTPAAAFLAALH